MMKSEVNTHHNADLGKFISFYSLEIMKLINESYDD
jgi:hypothetical protein